VNRVVAIVQARMGSERLPGKVLMDVAGKPLLAHCIERISRAKRVDEVVLATTDMAGDVPLLNFAKSAGLRVYAGSENDVLQRYREAAEFAQADIIVRITGDCPLIDPELSDSVIEAYLDSEVDLASNVINRTYPRGVDTEVFSMALLRYLNRFVTKQPEREHVTLHVYKNRDQFWIASVETDGPLKRPEIRTCVDTGNDLQFVREVFEALGKGGNSFSTFDVMELLDRRPELGELNAGVKQKST
jgi:spore coat polysaccharide biosynthesis protein SpsF